MSVPTTAHHHSHGPANRRRRVVETAAPLFVVAPQGPIRGGVVVLHDAAGLTEDIEWYCQDLAEAGWLAAAPYHYYESGGRGEYEHEVPDYARHPPAPAGLCADVRAALRYLEHRRGLLPETLSVLGFGMGGYLAAWAASDDELAGAVSFGTDATRFAGMPPLAELVPPRRTPWLDADGHTWPAVRRFLATAVATPN